MGLRGRAVLQFNHSMKRTSIKYLLLTCLIIILILFGGNGCFYIQTPSPTLPTPPSSNVTAPPSPGWTLSPAQEQSQPLPDFVSVVAKVKPSVVAINTEVVAFDIFRQPITEEGAGSGWILDKNGYIVTNNHVIDGARSIMVALDDGRTLKASVVGADAISDLAVLKVDATDLPAADIGDSSKLRIGEWVLAIGNALGQGITAKEGIVSRLGVSVQISAEQTLSDLIETSAPINPGNSGGPLINMSGEVIGITSAKLAAVEVEGLGYAISISTATPLIEKLVQQGYIIRPWLGISIRTVDAWFALQNDLAVDKGALIADVSPGSPAHKAGLKEGDIIVSANGEEISTAEELIQVIQSGQIGQGIEITFWRGETKSTTTAILAERPSP